MYVQLESYKERRVQENNVWRNNSQKFYKFDKNHKLRSKNRNNFNTISVKKTILRYIRKDFLKTSNKEKIWKAVREKRPITYKGKKVKMTTDKQISCKQGQWSNIFKVLKEKKWSYEPIILWLLKISLKNFLE